MPAGGTTEPFICFHNYLASAHSVLGCSREQHRYSSVPRGFCISTQINRERSANPPSFETPRPDVYQPVVLSWGWFGNIQRHFWLLQLGEASKRPGMLLNIPQHAGQSPTAKNYRARNTNTAQVWEPGLGVQVRNCRDVIWNRDHILCDVPSGAWRTLHNQTH